MRSVLRWFAIPAVLLFAGCGGSSGDSLPQGTFSCLVNGAAFPAGSSWFAIDGAQIVIWAVTDDEVRYVQFRVNRPAAVPANIRLDSPPANWAMYDTDADRFGNGSEYYTTTPATGTLAITSLTAERCTGTFSFIARQTPGTARVGISSGSFDLGPGPVQW
jgi:hypothetical protein